MSEEIIVDQLVEEAYAERYGLYATAVILGRAVPAIEDGLLPVMRRSVYAMYEHGSEDQRKFTKAAKFVGDTLGGYHPHGDNSVYESMLGLSQDFNKLNLLIDPQGNVGKISGDGAAAMRYVELRLSKFTRETLFSDFSKNYIKHVDNYDGSRKEPLVLPSSFPIILNTGINGIASGFVSDILPHKVDDICGITIDLIKNPNIKIKDLVKNFRPDFPTGAEIVNEAVMPGIYESGQGTVTVQATIVEETIGKKQCLVVKDLPYKVKTNDIIEQIVALVKNDPKTKEPNVFTDKIENVQDLSDSKTGSAINLVITPKKDVSLDVVRNLLYTHTRLRIEAKYISNVLYNGEFIENADIKTILSKWIEYRINILSRKYNYEIKNKNEQLAYKKALLKAQGKIDEVIKIIKQSKSEDQAITEIRELLDLNEKEAKYIVNIRLYQISNVEVGKLKEEIKNIQLAIDELIATVSSKERILEIIVSQLTAIKNKYKSERKTRLSNTKAEGFDVRTTIESEDLVLAISSDNYVYAKASDEMRDYTKRGGKGSNFIDAKYKKTIRDIFVVNSHDDLLVFTNTGNVIEMKGYQFKLWHKPISHAIEDLGNQEVISVIKANRNNDKDKHFVFCTASSLMKRVEVSEMFCQRRMKGGNIAIKIPEGDTLVGVALVDSEDDEIVITSNHGRMQRMPAKLAVVAMRPTSGRPRALLDDENGEYIKCMTVVKASEVDNASIIVAGTTGIGKLVKMEDLPVRRREGTGRGGMIKIIALSGVAELVCGKAVVEGNQIVVTTSANKSLKLDIDKLNSYSRTAKGTRIVTMNEDEYITDIAVI